MLQKSVQVGARCATCREQSRGGATKGTAAWQRDEGPRDDVATSVISCPAF